MSFPPLQRIVAIVGRPNVGKSALFNRLVGRRVAIVHEESGVTRDRLSCEAVWEDQRLELIDTGGVGLLDGAAAADEIAAGTRRQVDLAIQDAAVALLVVDITSGPLPLDQEVAGVLRRSGRRAFVAANKADHSGMDAQAVAFEELGFPVFPVSALHNRGVSELMEAVLPALPAAAGSPAQQALRVAIVGRPNVGKSSYLNRLLRSERVIVSEVPGTTRDSIEIPFAVGKGPQARRYVLIDTAGMRRARHGGAVDKFSVLRAEESIRRSDLVVVILDAAEGPRKQDKKIVAMAEEHEKGCLLLVNKWDLAIEQGVTQTSYGKALRAALPFAGHLPVLFASAKSGYNIRQTIEAVDYVAAQVSARLPTGLLNRVIHDAARRVQPPSVDGRRLKIYYATQVGVQPVTIRLFVNQSRRVDPAYRSYLIGALREAFGLEGAPVVLQFRGRQRDAGHGHAR